jgi:hypothetical protein
MSYLKLKKQNGAFDLVPCDNIIYVDGTEGAAETGGAGSLNGLSPFVQIVYGMPINSSDGLDLVATKVILGSNNQDVATTTAATVMQNAVNDAIVAAASQMEPVEVDFSGLLKVAGYVPIVAGETFVASAGPVDYAFT